MKNFSNVLHAVSVVILLFFCIWGRGQEETSEAPMEKTEKEALHSTIQGFVGNWWNGSDLYPDPCGSTPIQGVSCDLFGGFWYVTALHIGPLEENSLDCAPEVEFRPDLFVFKHLKSLSFFSCFVSPRLHPVSLPTDSWEVLSGKLESLEFRSNPGLTGQIPTGFGHLRSLQSLVLLENGLTGELPTTIGNLTNLRRLVLSANGFKGQIPFSFGGLDKLLIIDLSKNSLSGPLPSTFGGLTSLLKLDLSNNQIKGKIPSEIGNLTNLTLLDLSRNNFSGGLTQSLQELCSLEELLLSNNPIHGDLSSVEWHRLQGMITLDLSNLGLTGGIPDSIAELKSLRFLGLNDNKLTGNLSPKLAAMPSVGAIYLNGNNLTGELKFSEEFYGKMGRRFGAWNNPNLCYQNGVGGSSSHGPYGVRQCDQEVTLHEIDPDTKSSLGNGPDGNLNQNSQLMPSFGFPIHGADVFWCLFLVPTSMMLLLS